MKWILKIAAAVIGAVLLVGGGVVCWYYRQATALPEWYAEEVARQEERTLEEEHTDLPDPQWEDAVVLDEPEEAEEEDDDDAPEAAPRTQKVLRGFHRRGKGKSTKAVRASRATYRGGKLEAGVVLDLSQIPRDNLSEHDRDLLERAATNFPGIAKRNVYVGIEDHPVAVDGVLQLGSQPTIRIGRLRYSLPTAAGRLGMAPATLRAELDRELRRLHLTDPAHP